MAKRHGDQTSEDKAKIRILFAEVEGNNETVQEAMKTMISAMSRNVRPVQIKANGDIRSIPQVDQEDEISGGVSV